MERRAALDSLLRGDVRDLLAHDRRLRDCRIGVEVLGGVAHLTGVVPSDEERWLVRQLAGRLQGVYAVWDLVCVGPQRKLRILDLGCGRRKQIAESVGLDRHHSPSVDIIADLEGGLPLAGESFDHVFTVHVLEHVHHLLPLMNEIHRVLKADGVLHVLAPDWHSTNAVADPTHVRFFNTQTFKSFCRPGPDLSPFWPLAVSRDRDTVYADLRPVKGGTLPPGPETLARFFD